MNTQTQEALKMAKSTLDKLSQRLENKDCGYVCSKVFKDYRKTISAVEKQINACKEALAQPAQKSYEQSWYDTHPAPSWQGLSDYDILSIDGLDCVDENDLISFAHAVVAKLKEKNK